MISTQNTEQAKKLIKKEKPPIIVLAQSDNFNRKILEFGKFNILLGPKRLNNVMAKIAAKNKISVGYDLSKIAKLEKKEKAIALEKIKQIIKVLRKTRTKIKILNYKDKKDASALLISLGASTSQANQSVSF